MIPSTELTTYQKETFLSWRYENNLKIIGARKTIKSWLAMGYKIRMDGFFCFPKRKLYNLDGTTKKMDVKNRLKALHDCFSEHLRVDDSKFWSGYDEKIQSDNIKPWCFVIITPFKDRTLSDLKKIGLEGYC